MSHSTPEPRLPWPLLAAGGLGMFAASTSGTSRSPFLLDLSRDLDTALPLVANLVAVTSIAWGIASLVAGAGSDRWGRRPFLIGGPLGVALCMLAISMAGSFAAVALWATLGGFCAGAFTGVIMAEVSARVRDRQRGRAMGFVMAGQSMTLLLGVPLAAWLGVYVGWRGVHLCTAALLALAATGLFLATLRPAEGGGARRGQGVDYRAALSPRVLRLLAMGTAERICYGLTAVFFATFLQVTYGLTLGQVALPLAIFALGNILGTLVGGQAADRLPNRLHVFGAAMLASALVGLPFFAWRPGLVPSVAMGFAYAFVTAMARPSLMAMLAQVPAEVRGTVLGLNVTAASLGWLGAASLGGMMMASFGFGAFGPLASTMALLGAGFALVRGRGA